MGASIAEGRTEIVELLRDAAASLTAAVESGFGFDYAVYQYSQQADNELARAFKGVLHEMQSGVPRRRALTNLAKRINVSEVTTFAKAVIRADQHGISILETLRSQSEQIGQKRLSI